MFSHVFVKNAKNCDAYLRQLDIAINVVHLAGEIRYVSTSVDLDRQVYLCAIEVENVADERVLAAKL